MGDVLLVHDDHAGGAARALKRLRLRDPEAVARSKRLLWSGLDADQVAVAETNAHRFLMTRPRLR